MLKNARLNLANFAIAGVVAIILPIAFGATAAAAELTPASLRLKWLPQAQFIGYYVAKAKDYYAQEGIALTIIPGGPNIIAENMVASGNDTFGHGGGMTSLLEAREKGLPIVGIGMLFQQTPQRFVVLKGSGINKFTDIKGKTVSTWFTGPQFMLQAMIKASGLDPRDVHIEAQGNSMVPFIEGKVDMATVTVYNEMLALKRRNVIPSVVFDPNEMGFNFPAEAIIVNENTIKKNPKLVQGFLAASLKGWTYALTHQDEAIDILMKRVPTANRVEQKEMLAALPALITSGAAANKGIGYVDMKALEFAQKFLIESGVMKSAVDLKSAVDTTFWDKVPANDKIVALKR